MKYEFTGETKNGLKRIRRISDGLVGGWIENESNLSHYGDCFVYDNARVCGNAKVYGNAWVYHDARVFDDDIVSQSPALFDLGLGQHRITVTDNHVNIGCKQHTLDYWLENYQTIGIDEGYPEEVIEKYGKMLRLIQELKTV